MFSLDPIDRRLVDAHPDAAGQRLRRAWRAGLRSSVPTGTVNNWKDPEPGLFEADLRTLQRVHASSLVWSLVLTDVFIGWTDGAALLVREGI